VIESAHRQADGRSGFARRRTYTCPTVMSEETQRLRESIHSFTVTSRAIPKRRSTTGSCARNHLAAATNRNSAAGRQPQWDGDNSNTQFATLGLWWTPPGLRWKKPWPASNSATHSKSRWRLGYQAIRVTDARTPLTCAGLLGLAVYGYRWTKEERQIELDRKSPADSLPDLQRSLAFANGLLAWSTLGYNRCSSPVARPGPAIC